MLSLSMLVWICFVLSVNYNGVEGQEEVKSCATLFKEEGFGDGSSDNYILKDGSRVSNFAEEYFTMDSVWNLTRSFQLETGCVLTACNSSYFDGNCQDFKENVTKLPQEFENLLSGSCTCENNCKCSDIVMKKSSCGRAYLKGGCNTCNPLYVDLRGSKPYFPLEFSGQVESIIVRPGCSLKVHPENEDYEEGQFELVEGIREEWKGSIGSYDCECSSYTPPVKPPRPEGYPVLIDIPDNIDEISSLLMREDFAKHPGLKAARLSLKSGRSSKNAYILLLGTTGSGKSTAINLLFDNPNVTVAGTIESTTSDIHEFRIPVPIDELGIQNSELRVIDTPGLGDTRGLDQDSKFLATLDDYLSTHDELSDKMPNVVLIFHKFNDNRIKGDSSFFVKMLRGLDSFRKKITDENYSNIIFVLSHFCSETKERRRRPNVKLAQFKTVIEDYSQFPKPIVITVAENKADEESLPVVNGYWKLPNGDYYPKNLFDKIQVLTSSGNDPIGDAVIRTAFRDSENFNITPSTFKLVESSSNTKVIKYMGILQNSFFNVDNTEISQLLANSSEIMDAKLKQKFPAALKYLQKALNIRGIVTKSNIPRTTLGILELLASLNKNEANIFLLQNALSLQPPVYEDNVVTGYSYNVFTDSQLSKSPYKLGEVINSDIGYLFPSAMTCNVENDVSDIYKTTPNKAGYLKMLLSNLGIDGTIPVDEFKGSTKPGFNVEEEQFLNDSCLITAVREIRTFELKLNENPKLTPEFISAVKALPAINQSDFENVNTWKSFFNDYGTHVVKSVHGGGAIVIELTSNKECDVGISSALFQLIQFAEDLTEVNENSTKTFKQEGIQHTLKFKGGDNSYHTTDLTKLSINEASKLLRGWKKSLRLKPAILTSEMMLYPISSVAKSIGQNVSSEIQRATSLLFNSTLKFVQKQKTEQNPTDRAGTALATENTRLVELIEKMLENSQHAEAERIKWMNEMRLSEERRFNATQEFNRWEREMRANQTRDEQIAKEKYQKAQTDMMQKHLDYQKEVQRNQTIDAEARRVAADKLEKQRQKELKDQKDAADAKRRADTIAAKKRQDELDELNSRIQELANRKPTTCLRTDTPILMANGAGKAVQDLEVGDMVMDHNLKPTKVLGVSREFLMHSSFYGFEKGSYFFTNSHMFVGPKLGSTSGSADELQLYAKDTEQLVYENPLLEYLNVQDMDVFESGFQLYHFNTRNMSVESNLVQVFEDPSAEPEDSLVYFIQVDSPSGTYFANGYACRHEIPPIEIWPNTMAVIFAVFSNPDLPKLKKIPFTMSLVGSIDEIVEEVRAKTWETLRSMSLLDLLDDEPNIVFENAVVEEVLGNVYNEPMFSRLGVGIYGSVGKLMAGFLDNSESGIPDKYIGNVQKTLVRVILDQIVSSVSNHFGSEIKLVTVS